MCCQGNTFVKERLGQHFSFLYKNVFISDFVPDCHHAKFGSKWITNEGETEGRGHNGSKKPQPEQG